MLKTRSTKREKEIKKELGKWGKSVRGTEIWIRGKNENKR